MTNLRISWQGEILAQRGYGAHVRRILKPLIQGGADVKLIPDEDYIPQDKRITDPWWIDQIAKSKLKPDMPLHIMYCIPPLAKPVKGAINILFSNWDTTHYPREWIPTINQMNRFWVGTPSLLKSAQNAGIKVPIDVLSSTIDTTLWTPEGESTKITEIPNDTVKFMFVGDWIPRKNYQDLIIGYITAFSGCKDTALIIKTWSNQPGGDGRKNIEQAVRHFVDKLVGIDKPKIYLLTDMIDEEQIIPMMRGTDAYVSVSHGESYDSSVVQAMALEKLVVATNFLAHDDYLRPDNSLIVKHTLCPVYDGGGPQYQAYQLWSNPDIWDYISKLRLAYQMIKEKKQDNICKAARKKVIELFSEETNTPRIAKLIENCLAKQAIDTPKGLIQKVVSQLV